MNQLVKLSEQLTNGLGQVATYRYRLTRFSGIRISDYNIPITYAASLI